MNATAPAAPTSPPARGTLPYFPGLEGLRGVAVVAVLLFHSEFTWMQGGYLGVSTFFTLSGFLITSLLLAERGATAAIDLRAFWRRRWRRLLPATFATFALVALFGVLAAEPAQQRALAPDVLAAMAYVANWKFILAQQSYADLFAAPSPVLHFWSLAIEEQFYLLYPRQKFQGRNPGMRNVLGFLLLVSAGPTGASGGVGVSVRPRNVLGGLSGRLGNGLDNGEGWGVLGVGDVFGVDEESLVHGLVEQPAGLGLAVLVEQAAAVQEP